jgi:hypothetical protein
MTFGKYRGWPVDEVPSDYLAWMLRKCRRLNVWLHRAIEQELRQRSGGDN